MTEVKGAVAVNNSHLKRLVGEIERVITDSRTLFAGLSDEQLVWKPKPGVWCVGECFGHLVATGDGYYPKISRAIERTRRDNMRERNAFRAGLLAGLFVRILSPNSKLKVKAPRNFRPALRLEGAPAQQRFIEQQQGLIELIGRADGFDLNTIKIPSPVSKLVKFSIGEALWVQSQHLQRHLLQAQRLSRLPDFPE